MSTIGDRVFSDIFNTGARSYDAKYQRHGGFSSFAIAPGVALRPFPVDDWSFDQAANYCGAYETAYHALVACGGASASSAAAASARASASSGESS